MRDRAKIPSWNTLMNTQKTGTNLPKMIESLPDPYGVIFIKEINFRAKELYYMPIKSIFCFHWNLKEFFRSKDNNKVDCILRAFL